MKPMVPKLDLSSTQDSSKSWLKFLLLCSIISNMRYEDLQLLNINPPDTEEIAKDEKSCDDCNNGTDDSIRTISWFEILQWIRLLSGRLRTSSSSSYQTFKCNCNEASTDAVYQITVSKSPVMSSWKVQCHAQCHSSSDDGDIHRILIGEFDIVEDDGELYFDGIEASTDTIYQITVSRSSTMRSWKTQCHSSGTDDGDSDRTLIGEVDIVEDDGELFFDGVDFTGEGDEILLIMSTSLLKECTYKRCKTSIDLLRYCPDGTTFYLNRKESNFKCHNLNPNNDMESLILLIRSAYQPIELKKFIEKVKLRLDEHNEQSQFCTAMVNGDIKHSIECLLKHKGIAMDMNLAVCMYIIQMRTVTVHFSRKLILHLLELNPCLYRHGIKSHKLHQLMGRYITHRKLSKNNDSLHYSSFVDLQTLGVEREDELSMLYESCVSRKNLEAINFHKCLEEYYVKLRMNACDADKMRHILIKNLNSILTTSSMNTGCSKDGGNMTINDPDKAPLAYIKPVGIFKHSKYDEQESKKSSDFCDIQYLPRVVYQELPEEKSTAPPYPDVRDINYRISTLRNSRILNCSVEDVASAGFYIDRNGFISCFRCNMKFHAQDFRPQDPFASRWHGSPCANSRTQHDGRISDDARDPPGQQSIYIPSGNVRSEQYRLSTFANYPVAVHVSKINLAQAGFYFTGFSDRVKCFSCGRTVESWEPGDNPADTTWHKSNCGMTLGFHSENIPMTSRLASAQVRNSNFSTQQRPNLHVGHPTDITHRTRPTQQRNHGISPRPQTPRQWQMAQVMSSDHRRFLSNLFLNRELDRLSSFARWPTRRPNAPPSALAKTGFFYLGDLDRTQCFSCGGVLRNWTVNDNALSEHRDHFADCPMVLGAENRNVPIPEQPESREERERKFTCRYPSNPHMRSEATRLDTFDRRWPIGKTAATPEEIAQAGFFFLGERDRVKCWYCNGGLQNWDYDDAPWVEHAKWFPNCQFLLRAKGQHFVHRHLSAHPHLPRPIIAKQEGANLDVPATAQASSARQQNPPMPGTGSSSNQPAATLTIIDPREEKRKRWEHIQNVMKNSDIVKSIIFMGFDAKIVEGLLEDKLASGKQANSEDIYDSMTELLNDVMDRERQITEESTQAKMPTGATNAAFAIGGTDKSSSSWSAPRGRGNKNFFPDDDDEDEAMEMYESTPATSTAVHGSALLGAMGSSVDVKDNASLQDAVTQMQEEGLCKICFSNQADMVFMPCGHMCCCMECTQAIRQCPICRKQIDKAIKTYRS